MNRRSRSIIAGLFLSTISAAASGQEGSVCIEEKAQKTLNSCPGGEATLAARDMKAPAPRPIELGKTAAQSREKPPLFDAGMGEPWREPRSQHSRERGGKLAMNEIAQLEELWKATSKDAADRVQLARRLAETYAELASRAFRDKVEAEIKKDQAAADKAKKLMEGARSGAIKYYRVIAAEYRTYPQLDEVLYYLAYEHEQAQNQEEARRVYLQLISDTPLSRYIPHAYLAFGELFFAEGQTDPAKFELARQSYAKVLEYPEAQNKVFGYALYKLGYVHWNLGERENLGKALDFFKKTIEYAGRHAGEPGVVSLAKNARKDIVPVYALVGKPGEAFGFFKPLSGDKSPDAVTYEMMDNLGLNYLDTGHYAEAITLYEDLLRRDKGDQSCTYQARVVQATMSLKGGGDKATIRDKLGELARQAAAFRAGSHGDEAKNRCGGAAVELLYETAVAWQLEAQGSGGVRGTGDRNTMKLAAESYSLITEHFTKEDLAKFEFPRLNKEDWPTLSKIKLARADMLYVQGDWVKCGPAFAAVVDDDPKGPDAAEAAYASVLCYKKSDEQTHAGRAVSRQVAGDRVRPRKPDLARQELTEGKQGMVRAFDRYLCSVKPDDARSQDQFFEIKFARARTYFEAHQWEEAAVAFRDLAINHKDHEGAISAAQLYLEAKNIVGSSPGAPRPACFDEMSADLATFQGSFCEGSKARAHEEECAGFTRVQCDFQRLKAQKTSELASKGGPGALRLHEEAAGVYLDLWKKYGEAPLEAGQKARCERLDEVLYNAAESFQAAHLVMKSIQVRLLLLNPRYGMDRSDLARKSTHKIGGNFQAIAVYDEAARWYEKYSKEFPKAEKADSALSDAVVLRLGLGQDADAIKDADEFMKSYGSSRPAETARVAFAIGAHYAEHEDWESARKRLAGALGLIDKSAPLDVQIQAHALLGRALARLGSASGADAEYGKARALWKEPRVSSEKILAGEGGERRLARALTAVGEASFYFAEKSRKEVEALKFPVYQGPDSKEEIARHIKTRVATWMKRKRAAIEGAEREYLKVVQLEPVPPPRWVIASGARVGHLWGEFVREFRVAPVPSSIRRDDELRGAYVGAIDEASEPQKQRAKGAFETCLSYSVKYQFFDEHSRSCEEWLSRFYKGEYHQIDEFRGAPGRASSGLNDRALPLDINGKPTRSESSEPPGPVEAPR